MEAEQKRKEIKRSFDSLGMSRVLERVVPHPEVFVCLSTSNFQLTSRLGQWPTEWFPKDNLEFVGKVKRTKNLYQKNHSTDLAPFGIGYEAGTGVVRLHRKDKNAGFSHHIKTGNNLPVCITSFETSSRSKQYTWCRRL